MANPQKENGYLQIATELWEALAHTRIPGECGQVLNVVIRYTYGWHKKHATIGTFQIMEATGLSKNAVEKARRRLRSMNIISTSQKGGPYAPLEYTIQKDYHTWKLPAKKVVPPKKEAVVPPKKAAVVHPNMEDTKDTVKITKDKRSAEQAPAIVNNPILIEKLKAVYNDGFNIYGLIGRAKLKLKHPGARIFPDSVLLAVCDEYWKYKPKIKEAWPWFERVLVAKYHDYNASRHVAEHQEMKKMQMPDSIKDILKNIGKSV